MLRFAEAKAEMIGRKVPRAKLDDTRVSRMHAEVSEQNGAWLLRDVGSSNGTFVNGRRIRRLTELEIGDRIQMGRLMLRVMDVSPVGMAVDLPADPLKSVEEENRLYGSAAAEPVQPAESPLHDSDIPDEPEVPDPPLPLSPTADREAIEQMLDEHGDQIDLIADDLARERVERERKEHIEKARRAASDADAAAAKAEVESDSESPSQGTLHGQPGDSMTEDIFREIKPRSSEARDDLAVDQLPEVPKKRVAPDKPEEAAKGEEAERSEGVDPNDAVQPEEKEAILDSMTLSAKFDEASEEPFVLEMPVEGEDDEDPILGTIGDKIGGKTERRREAEAKAVEVSGPSRQLGRRWRAILAAAVLALLVGGGATYLLSPLSPWPLDQMQVADSGDTPDEVEPPAASGANTTLNTDPESGEQGGPSGPGSSASPSPSPPQASSGESTPSTTDIGAASTGGGQPEKGDGDVSDEGNDGERAVLASAGLMPPSTAFTEAPSVIGADVLSDRVFSEGRIDPEIALIEAIDSRSTQDGSGTADATATATSNGDTSTAGASTTAPPMPEAVTTGTRSVPDVEVPEPRTTATPGRASTAANEVARLLAALEDPVAQITDTSNRQPTRTDATETTDQISDSPLNKMQGPKKVVFLVDASGSLIDALPGVIDWLTRRVASLGSEDEFSIIFFREGEAIEVPPQGLKRATIGNVHEASEWVKPAEANITAHGRSDPFKALDVALSYQPDQIY
ncbi:MAG: FHA domain-containing protein, partial [Rhodospirillales bacterium]|nr:FHA domain-containing protein [Rhodospirillales bacterium]